MSMLDFRIITPCGLEGSYQRFGHIASSNEDGDGTSPKLWYISTSHTAFQPRRQKIDMAYKMQLLSIACRV